MKKRKSGRRSVQELMGIRGFTKYGLETVHGELLFFRVQPINISVLSAENIRQKIHRMFTSYFSDDWADFGGADFPYGPSRGTCCGYADPNGGSYGNRCNGSFYPAVHGTSGSALLGE